MAKAIHWPKAFREEVLAEDCETVRTAFRLGALYFEHRYWVPDEVVDIRVNHLRVRKGVVQGDLKLCALRELDREDYDAQKTGLRTLDDVMTFLRETYQQPVDPDTVVTVVRYKNLPLNPEDMDPEED